MPPGLAWWRDFTDTRADHNSGPFNFFNCSAETADERLSGSACVFYNAFDDVEDFEGFESIFSLDLFLLGENFEVGENLFLSRKSDLRELNSSESFPGAFNLSGGSIALPPRP